LAPFPARDFARSLVVWISAMLQACLPQVKWQSVQASRLVRVSQQAALAEVIAPVSSPNCAA